MGSIEEHYNKLRGRAIYLRSIVPIDGEFCGNAQTSHSELCARVRHRANELAAQDWPRVCSELARQRVKLPIGPITFGINGYNSYPLGAGRVCESRPRTECEGSYAEQAYRDLAPDLEREAAVAEQAFESYARAVEQGVAVPPSDSTDDDDE